MDVKMIFRIFSIITVFFFGQAQAFVVDKMFIVGDREGNGIITLTNTAKKTIFVQSKIDEFEIEAGHEFSKEPYNSQNVEDWKISLTHSQSILKPGESIDIGIRSLCVSVSCDENKDLMFFVTFTPSAYKTGGSDDVSSVEVNYGYAPVYIIPANKQSINYDIEYVGNELRVYNKSNTLLNLFIDACSDQVKTNCQRRAIILSGREKSLILPEAMQVKKLKVIVESNNREYSKTTVLNRTL
ncbi:hypothetical protein [Vibrio jasicida]|uniref:hypothetical protein n=1 Tax=Vibrio jasicida TaxID=766224 RepID=UPI0005ED57F6|nr:hypothetical protein [Vibrio jasicida]